MNVEEAIILAIDAHDGQKDKCGEAYILHPIEVFISLSSEGEDVKVVALLHDVIEDTDFGLLSYKQKFYIARKDKEDEAFYDPFHELSKPQYEALDAITRRPHPEETYKEYIGRVKENEIATIVKIADLKHNLTERRMHCLKDHERKGLTERYTWSLEELKHAGSE